MVSKGGVPPPARVRAAGAGDPSRGSHRRGRPAGPSTVLEGWCHQDRRQPRAASMMQIAIVRCPAHACRRSLERADVAGASPLRHRKPNFDGTRRLRRASRARCDCTSIQALVVPFSVGPSSPDERMVTCGCLCKIACRLTSSFIVSSCAGTAPPHAFDDETPHASGRAHANCIVERLELCGLAAEIEAFAYPRHAREAHAVPEGFVREQGLDVGG
jgi:hypothetical protein